MALTARLSFANATRTGAALLLAACAGATRSSAGTGYDRLPSAREIGSREQTADQQVHHALNRLGFGARPGDVAAVRAMGVDTWIARQLEPERIPDGATDALMTQFKTLDQTGEQLLAAYPPPGVALARLRASGGTVAAADSAKLAAQGRQSYAFVGELASSRVARALMTERQLNEVMVDFWENHFNVFSGKDRARYFLPEYDANAIRPNAMGKFRTLLGAVAKSPAMLYYLDNWQSVADSGQPTLAPTRRVALAAGNRRRGLNENYARELMELHTLGVDGGYTQHDVTDVARALTGWTIARGANGGDFTFRGQAHDAGPKTILGVAFPAGRGLEEGEAVLDMLARNPNTARFIATKLARRFVSDTPPPALVTRAAATFQRSDGDIRATLRTIVTSPEFFATAAYRAKVKSPFELVVSTLRAMSATPDASPRTAQLVSRLGQPIFGHQAPNGYPETGDAWMNTGAILNRINFGLTTAAGRVPGVKLVDWPATHTYAALTRDAQVDGVIEELFGGAVSTDTRQVLLTGTNPFLQARASSDTMPIDGATSTRATDTRRPMAGFAQIVGLALGAPEFQRR